MNDYTPYSKSLLNEAILTFLSPMHAQNTPVVKAVEQACLEAFMRGDTQSLTARMLRSAMHDLSHGEGTFRYAEVDATLEDRRDAPPPPAPGM